MGCDTHTRRHGRRRTSTYAKQPVREEEGKAGREDAAPWHVGEREGNGEHADTDTQTCKRTLAEGAASATESSKRKRGQWQEKTEKEEASHSHPPTPGVEMPSPNHSDRL